MEALNFLQGDTGRLRHFIGLKQDEENDDPDQSDAAVNDHF
jgi:hypothetical protein